MRNRYEAIEVIGDLLASMTALQELHISNLKDAMMAIRPAWVEVEQAVSSRKVVDICTISNKMIAAAGALAATALVLREMASDEAGYLAKVRRRPEPALSVDVDNEK